MKNNMCSEIDKIIKGSIDSGQAVGSGCAVFRNGEELYSEAFGFADREKNIPMSQNTIFRLFSLSKPVTSAAAMILIDRGLLSPDDPVSKFFTEYESLFYVENEQVLPCPRQLRVSHLLNMTLGIPYTDNWGISVRGAATLFDEIISGQNSGHELTTAEICRKAAKIPLMFLPGDGWYYGISADIMGGIIEAVSGMRYSEFLRKNIFEPLEMNDTGFFVPAEKADRFTALYKWQKNALIRDDGNYLGLTDYSKAPEFESGGAGLVSTIADYLKFARLLANKGEFSGVRLFSEKTFEFMTTPQLGRQQLKGLWDRLQGYNYGNFMRILENPEKSQLKTVNGEFGWDGWTGTFFCADPTNNIAILYFTQISGAGTTRQAELVCEEVYRSIKNI
ncbi:MAG: beta-lactamase family protein [Ruminococcus sp.]|nr:beta-lactamase family protein [Ruminococcus sp.]